MSSYPRSNPRKSNRSGLNVNNGGPWNPKLALKENNLWLNFEAQDFASEVSNKHAFKTWRKKRSDFFDHSSTLNLSLVTCIFYVLSPCTVYIKLSNFILFSLENDDMESSKHCVKLLSLIFIIRCFTKLFLFHKERSVFRHVSASHLQNDYCLNLAFDPRRKNDNFQLFHPGHTYKRQNALCLTKILFISFYGAPLSFSYFLLQGKVLCFACISKSLARCLLSKAFQRPCWKNYVSGYVWHKSFIQTVKCFLFNQIIVYQGVYGAPLT